MSGGKGPASTGRWLPSLYLSLPLPEREGQTDLGDISSLEIEQNGEGTDHIFAALLLLSSEHPADSLRAAS